jgi:biopolymer transport protein ExbD
MSEINITPLIDVMLALLLIFMIAAPMITSKFALPLDSRPTPTQPRVLELTLGADGSVSHNGLALSGLELQAELYAFGAKEGPTAVQLRPAALTHYQYVIDVMSLARTAGLESIAIENPGRE